MTKLTKRQIEALEPTEKDYFVWDGELSGFGIRVFPPAASSSSSNTGMGASRAG